MGDCYNLNGGKNREEKRHLCRLDEVYRIFERNIFAAAMKEENALSSAYQVCREAGFPPFTPISA